MSVNFILVGGIEELARRNYEEQKKGQYRKDFVANDMLNGNFHSASESLFNSSMFSEIFGQKSGFASAHT